MPRTKRELPWKPTREQLQAAIANRVPDVIEAGIKLLFVGINPGLYSAAVRHHFAHPGNRFWPSVHAGGLTGVEQLGTFDDWRLPEFGLGITNLCPRPSARADELTPDELKRGAKTLTRKIKQYEPKVVAFLGITSYRTAFGVKTGSVGPQSETIGNSRLWVLPNPSGLNAHFLLPDLARLFGELKTALDQPRN